MSPAVTLKFSDLTTIDSFVQLKSKYLSTMVPGLKHSVFL